MTYPTFRPGQRVRSVFGEYFTVDRQVGCQVFVRGSSQWFHPTKVFAAAVADDTGAFNARGEPVRVSIPTGGDQ